MNDLDRSISDYVSIIRSMKPLCLGCLDLDPSIFDQRAISWNFSYPNLDPRKVVGGVDSGCMSCALIYAAFQSIGLDLRTSHDVQEIHVYNKGEGKNLMVTAEYLKEPTIQIELYTIQGNAGSPWSIINQSNHFSGNTASEIATQRMLEWIERCLAHHESCSDYSNVPLPTRVLDLGGSNEAIRLLETNNVSGPYVCLSHCWGISPTIVCTRETYNVFTNNIPWDLLPPLFRDAVEICRILKVQYLWIDKLCIIQHDKEDWAREGSRMAQIFEGSFLTIAALSSKDDKDPLFFKDEKHAPSQQIHTGLMRDETTYTVYSRIPIDYHPADYFRLESVHEEYPLMTRAWVYQERLLAPRVLYFGKELSWECKEASACECSAMTRGTKYKHSLSFTSTHSTSHLHQQWRDMIASFSRLRLTYEDDRLPALSGLAQQFQSRLQSPYLAGLWRNSLKDDLLWYSRPASIPEEPRYSTRKPLKWRAPTWSWASVEGPVRYFDPQEHDTFTYEIEIEIVSAECTLSSVDKMGAVSEGRLVVRGRGRPALLSHRGDCEGTDTRHFSIRNVGVRSYMITNHFTVEHQKANVDYDLIAAGLMEPNSDMSIHCLYIAGAPFERHFINESWNFVYHPSYGMLFLLLRCIEDKTFERIGFLHCQYPCLGESEVGVLNSLKEDTIIIL